MKTESRRNRKDSVRSYLHIADMLRREIRKMDVDPNGRLPSERELASLLGVSRPTLREALIVLELHNEIEIRVGSGIYLTQRADAVSQPDRFAASAAQAGPEQESFPLKLGDSPKDVTQLRYFLEGGLAAHAARFISASQLRQLKKCLRAMQTFLDKKNRPSTKSVTEADRLFHMTLAACTENDLLVQTLEELFDQRYCPVADTMHRHFEDLHSWEVAIQEHEEIYEAIAERDPIQAQAAMQRHLTRAHARLMTMIG